MPCYTEVTIEVKDKEIAEKALKQMGKRGTVTKNYNGTYSISLSGETMTTQFRDDFLQEYGVQVALEKAVKEGWDAYRQINEYGEVEVTLKQYTTE